MRNISSPLGAPPGPDPGICGRDSGEADGGLTGDAALTGGDAPGASAFLPGELRAIGETDDSLAEGLLACDSPLPGGASCSGNGDLRLKKQKGEQKL